MNCDPTCIVPCYAAQRPGGGLLNPGVKLHQALDQSIHPPTVHHSLGQLRGVFGNGTEHKRCSLLLEPLHTNTPKTKEPLLTALSETLAFYVLVLDSCERKFCTVIKKNHQK